MFHTPVYDRGAMTLQALRNEVGDETFLRILRSWYAENKYGNVTTADLIALAERRSGRQLDSLFQEWLFEDGRPRPATPEKTSGCAPRGPSGARRLRHRG